MVSLEDGKHRMQAKYVFFILLSPISEISVLSMRCLESETYIVPFSLTVNDPAI